MKRPRGSRNIPTLPGLRAWTRPFGGDWSAALKGMAYGLLVAGTAAAFAMLFEIIYQSSFSPLGRPGFGDMIFTLVMIPFGIAGYGTAAAIIPMSVIMGMERLLRIDLGMICWTTLGLVPSTIVGMAMPGTVFGGLAMASGGIGGMTAWTMRHAAQPGAASRWSTVSIAALAIAVLTIVVCMNLPPLADSD